MHDVENNKRDISILFLMQPSANRSHDSNYREQCGVRELHGLWYLVSLV